MKILIAYDSGNGTVKTAVDRLVQPLERWDVTVASLSCDAPDPKDFDLIVVGSSVRNGKLRAAARSFLKDYTDVLATKRLGLFFCCGLTEEQDYYAEKLFPRALRDAAFHTVCFGGSLKTEGLGFWDKMRVRSMRSHLFEKEMDNGNYIPNLPYILPENIDDMANAITQEALRLIGAEKR
jgi:menaquinone-dependent protoporphyrinogen oxidase